MINKILSSEDEMFLLAAELAKAITTSAIIFLQGPLGAGKTTFTRGFLRALGYQSKVKSPTFTLVEPYEIANQTIFHFDLYRLTNSQELEQIGIRDYFSQDAICLIEWPEKGFPLLPNPDLICHFAFSEKGREMSIESLTDKGKEILKRL